MYFIIIFSAAMALVLNAKLNAMPRADMTKVLKTKAASFLFNAPDPVCPLIPFPATAAGVRMGQSFSKITLLSLSHVY